MVLGSGLGFARGLGFAVARFFGFFGDGEATRSLEYCDKSKSAKSASSPSSSLGSGSETALSC